MTPEDGFGSNRGTEFPKARSKDLVIQPIGDDLLVYDMTKQKAHHLNETSAFVWQAANGRKSVDAIAEDLSKENGTPAAQDLIIFALSELERSELLETSVASFSKAVSRREVIRRYSAAAIAFPVVMSLVAPSTAQVASCFSVNQTGCMIPGNLACCAPLLCVPLGPVPGINVGICIAPPPPIT